MLSTLDHQVEVIHAERIGRPLVVFSGGTGTRSFGVALAKHFSPVTFIVNAYDDSKSTGRIREHLGLLGPSDLAKLIVMLSDGCPFPDVARIFRARLPAVGEATEQQKLLRLCIVGSALPQAVRNTITVYIEKFIEAVAIAEERHGYPFDFRDLAVRNAVLVGAAQIFGSYQAALDELVALLDLPAEVVVASEEVAFLVGVMEDGRLLTTEAEICECQLRPRLWRIHLLRRRPTQHEAASLACFGDPEATSRVLERDWAANVRLTERAVARLRQARGLLYAPGTLYSSIAPTLSLLAREVIAMDGPRVLMANLMQENEQITVAGIVEALWRAATGASPNETPRREQVKPLITHVLIDKDRLHCRSLQGGRPMPLARSQLRRLVHVLEHSLEDPQHLGLHSPKLVLEALEELFSDRTLINPCLQHFDTVKAIPLVQHQ